MAGTTPTPEWTVVGKYYNGSKVDDIAIHLPVTDICIPSRPDSSGKPISKALAEMYVSNLVTLLGNLQKYQPSKTPTTALEIELKKQIDNIDSFLSLIVNVSCGVTFDRDLISKILSQPKCEGIRCYFCAKGTDQSPQVTDTENCAVSLVVVGVGGDGKDLNWPSLATTATAQPVSTGATTPTTATLLADDGSSPSLAGEYGTPPPPTFEAKKSDPSFALLKNALTLI